MDRVHEPRLHPETIMQHLHHDSDTVSGTRSIRDNHMPLRIVETIIHPHHHREIRIPRRSRDQHLPGPRLQVLRGPRPVPEPPRSLDDQPDPQIPPGKPPGIRLIQHPELPPTHHDAVPLNLHRERQSAMDTVILQEMSHRLGIPPIHRDEIEIETQLQGCPVRQPPRPAEPVYTHTDSHGESTANVLPGLD